MTLCELATVLMSKVHDDDLSMAVVYDTLEIPTVALTRYASPSSRLWTLERLCTLLLQITVSLDTRCNADM